VLGADAREVSRKVPLDDGGQNGSRPRPGPRPPAR
jgi:hypothetical protein